MRSSLVSFTIVPTSSFCYCTPFAWGCIADVDLTLAFLKHASLCFLGLFFLSLCLTCHCFSIVVLVLFLLFSVVGPNITCVVGVAGAGLSWRLIIANITNPHEAQPAQSGGCLHTFKASGVLVDSACVVEWPAIVAGTSVFLYSLH